MPKGSKTPGDALPSNPSLGRLSPGAPVTQADSSSGFTPDNDRDHNGRQHQRITRQHWPKDRQERREAIRDALPQALGEYFGNSVAIAAALSLLPQEVEEVIASDPALVEAKRIYENSVDARLEDVITHAALTEGNVAAAKYLLERRSPDRWVRQSVNKKTDQPKPKVPDAPLVPAFTKHTGGN